MIVKVKDETGSRLLEMGFKPFAFDLYKRSYTFQARGEELARLLSHLRPEDRYEAKNEDS